MLQGVSHSAWAHYAKNDPTCHFLLFSIFLVLCLQASAAQFLNRSLESERKISEKANIKKKSSVPFSIDYNASRQAGKRRKMWRITMEMCVRIRNSMFRIQIMYLLSNFSFWIRRSLRERGMNKEGRKYGAMMRWKKKEVVVTHKALRSRAQ